MMNRYFKFYFLLCVIMLVSYCLPGYTLAEGETQSPQDDTMLMFVGEDLSILSIASRREESAWQAPAVAKVITRRELKEQGLFTLSQALATTPGFHMAQKEWGSLPYLRGVPNSTLFLYDTVPMGSDTTKSLHYIDHELSLAPVKRVEIVRGPGSVLWGPDAFAGIVNVVPMSGKDLQGIETGVLYGAPGDQRGLFANLGHDGGYWDGFLSVSGRKGEEDRRDLNLVRFWGDGLTPVAPKDRLGISEPDEARYAEASARFSLRDWITVSGRISDYRKPYSISAYDSSEIWQESRSAPIGLLKLEAKKDLDHRSAIRFTGSYTSLKPQFEIIDRTLEQRENTTFGELIYDRSLFAGRGLFTSGVSYREKRIRGAPVWDSYLPEFLGSDNTFFLPQVIQTDYSTRLWSVFGQYTHKVGDFDFLFGLRGDEHRDYRDHLSYSLGVVWSPSSRWVAKVLYGSSYRTPFSRQLINEADPDLEKMETLCAQISFKPSRNMELGIVGFTEKLKNHIMEDPYAGLSEANTQRINGIELEGRVTPFKGLELSANLTLLDNSGPDETYRYNDFTFIRPDGTIERHYVDLRYPYDVGPKRMFNLMGTWKPIDRLTASLRLGYVSSRLLIYPRGENLTAYPSSEGVWILDMSATLADVFIQGLDLSLSIKNLADRRYETPGIYDSIEGAPFSMELTVAKRW
ncbi:MAG: TonB-dependent receptor [Desulfobacteraceae bacterium]|nr:MAG: TonB-dependent receptor [Desulfobacteraceae bacterium]